MTHDPGAQAPSPSPAGPRPSRFPPALRWSLVFVVIMLALIVAIWPRGDGPTPTAADPSGTPVAPSGGTPTPQVDDAQLAQARAEAAVQPCPESGVPAGPRSVLAGVTAPCLATGAPYDIGAGTAGMPLVINIWAVWCLPCRRELPVLADYAARADGKVDVLTLHAQQGADNPFLVLKFLTELGVHLPTVLDVDGAVSAALEAPRVFPSTILVRADGTVAKVLPRVFETPDEIADVVAEHLGVAT